MPEEVIVIGGGFAGLAAGVALSEAGRRVRLLEQKPYLGGRARSFQDSSTGSTVDNGQHLFMGCYHATMKFLETIGASERIHFQPQLRVPFIDPGRKNTELRCPGLPSPWHLVSGVFLSNSFSFREKLHVLRMGRALQAETRLPRDASSANQLTVEAWLQQLGQPERLRRNFWDLICIAVMNEDPRIASAALFEQVLRRALFTSPLDSRLGIPLKGLSECYTDAAVQAIHERGGQVELRRDVRELVITEGTCRGARFADGTVVEADQIVCAVPWYVVPMLLPSDVIVSGTFFSRVLKLQPAPIISIYLWFDRPVTNLDFAGLRGTTIQWLFNRGRLLESGENYVSLVLSGAHDHISRSKEDLQDTALAELATLLPGVQDAKLLHSLVIKERFATFSPRAGVESLRLTAETPVRGLYLAGDWTDTGLPATIEGAVQSGYTAAQKILEQS